MQNRRKLATKIFKGGKGIRTWQFAPPVFSLFELFVIGTERPGRSSVSVPDKDPHPFNNAIVGGPVFALGWA
jgi:hypothetical protein